MVQPGTSEHGTVACRAGTRPANSEGVGVEQHRKAVIVMTLLSIALALPKSFRWS